MRSTMVGTVAALIVLAFAGAAYYYWHGGGESPSDETVTGVVVAKDQRQAGTEAGGKTLEQGMRLLTGESLTKDMFYYVQVKTPEGAVSELEVSRDFYAKVKVGDTIHRARAAADPVITKSDAPAQ
ncbi:MAG TPA: hypothetical protein PLO37_13425 [Candidatus Hydrogenedentes bacterium]|nr:hypothetical protein [Candidatus Hydrogenedentota bacterium]HPG67844.1 hypothetical protein [Candidatus Hydrogenedentota bacterium]